MINWIEVGIGLYAGIITPLAIIGFFQIYYFYETRNKGLDYKQTKRSLFD